MRCLSAAALPRQGVIGVDRASTVSLRLGQRGALYSSTLDERNVIRILNQEMKIMTNVLYDRTGVPCAYVAEDGTIFSFVGKPLAFLQNEYVYSFSGAELGTFEDGWLRDVNGNCVMFAKGATGFAPIKPICQICPVPAIPSIPPIRPIPVIPYIKAIKSCAWSRVSANDFFG